MFDKSSLSLVAFWLVAPVLAFAGDQTADENKATDESIAQLIVQLADSSVAERAKAEESLLKFGPSALRQLTSAAETQDTHLEISSRASMLVEMILVDAQQSQWLGIKLALLDRGEFSMGSKATEKRRRVDESRHNVRLSKPFMIAHKEITQKDYLKVMGATPSWFSKTAEGKAKINTPTDDFPVDSVSWFDAIEFCNRLSKRDHFPPYYEITQVKMEQNSIVSAEVKIKGGIGYRLPTEAEWEYACRAGGSTPYHFGEATGKGRKGNFHYRRDSYSGPTNYALGRTTTVGSYKPNAWGLYDMHGNVAEWCWDFYGKSYYDASPARIHWVPQPATTAFFAGDLFS